jgi:hypothetical protein
MISGNEFCSRFRKPQLSLTDNLIAVIGAVRVRSLFRALLVVSSLSACDSQGAKSPHQEANQFATPEVDAENAIKRGSYSLMAIRRFAVVVPGVNAEYEVLRSKFRITIVPGTSDIIDKDEDSFGRRVKAYAARYNRYVLVRLGCSAEKPMATCTNHVP